MVGARAAVDRRFAMRVALAAVVAVVSLCALFDSVAAKGFSAECDNLAGTCLRGRQAVAILAIDLACIAGALAALNVAVRWVSGRSVPPRLAWTALALSAVLAVVVLGLQPAAHLDNRLTGWLHA